MILGFLYGAHPQLSMEHTLNVQETPFLRTYNEQVTYVNISIHIKFAHRDRD